VLLDHIDHRVPELLSLHGHNEQHLSQRLISRLLAGDDVGLVSDAGTPLINDPGYPLVAAAYEAGVRVVPIPGACSIISALSVCPLPCHPFRFIGFLPAKSSARLNELRSHLARSDALVFLEAPHRILATLEDLAELTARRVMVAREMTKQYESIYVGSLEEVRGAVSEQPRGEFVVVVEASDERQDHVDEQALMLALLQELPPTKAAKVAAAVTGSTKAQMYEIAQQLKDV